MKIDNRILFLLIPPVVALVLCSLSSFVLPKDSGFTPEQPEFLTYFDALSVFNEKNKEERPLAGVKDIFRHEWIGLPEMEALPAQYSSQGIMKPLSPLPREVEVTMIVSAGNDSYCLINDRKMRLGDKTDNFKVTSIQKDQVTITYKNGNRETHHVKLY
jgi:hypothetical protein